MFEWDEEKRAQNFTKHGVDFYDLAYVDWEFAVFEADQRKDYGEVRVIAYVPIQNRLHICIFTQRTSKRIISLRKANQKEVVYYVNRTHASH